MQANALQAVTRPAPRRHANAASHSALWAVGAALAFLAITSTTAQAAKPAAEATAAAKVAAPDLNKGAEIANGVCVACHGVGGNSEAGANPILAAQHAGYIAKQLNNFKPDPNGKEPERNNAIMAGFAAELSADDIRNVSAYYSAQTMIPSFAQNKDILARGQQIYRAGIAAKGIPSCAGCHGPAGQGIPAQYPRLAGQYAEYTASQLAQFRSKERKNSLQMNVISAQLNDEEIAAVSEYIAGLRPAK